MKYAVRILKDSRRNATHITRNDQENAIKQQNKYNKQQTKHATIIDLAFEL